MIDGLSESQRMMGGRRKGESRGHARHCCRSSCECNEVRQRRGAARRSERYGEAGSVETDGTVRRGEEWKTRDCRADSAEPSAGTADGCPRNLPGASAPIPEREREKREPRAARVCLCMRVDDF